MSESAVSAKQGCVLFGAKPAQSETPVRAAAKRRPLGKRTKWDKLRSYLASESGAGRVGGPLIGVSGGADGEEGSTPSARKGIRKRANHGFLGVRQSAD